MGEVPPIICTYLVHHQDIRHTSDLAGLVAVDGALIGYCCEVIGVHCAGNDLTEGGGEGAAVGGFRVNAVAPVHEVVTKVLYLAWETFVVRVKLHITKQIIMAIGPDDASCCPAPSRLPSNRVTRGSRPPRLHSQTLPRFSLLRGSPKSGHLRRCCVRERWRRARCRALSFFPYLKS